MTRQAAEAAAASQAGPDVLVENHGSVMLFRPGTGAGWGWLEENVREGHWWGDALAVEPRYARDLAEGMLGDGLRVE